MMQVISVPASTLPFIKSQLPKGSEYIGGIEVVKTFNQGERSYKKYADAVAENETAKATWFKQTNGYYVMGLSILTATLVGVLPLGSWLFINGRVEAGHAKPPSLCIGR